MSMMRTNFGPTLIILIMVVSVACGDDTDSTQNNTANNGTQNNGTQPQACVPYTPEEPGDQSAITLGAATDRPEFTLETPDGVGGGYWTIEATNIPETENYEFTVLRDGAEIGVMQGTGGSLGSDFAASFLTAPEVTYTLTTGFSTPASVTDSDVPADYELAWQFHPTVDCYEPNPSAAEAAIVPVGEELEAFLTADLETANDSREFETDWYSFTIDEAGTYAAVGTQSPTSASLGFAIHDAQEQQVGYNFPQQGGALPDLEVDLQPGQYFLEVTNRSASEAQVGSATVPDAWTTPYRFQIERR